MRWCESEHHRKTHCHTVLLGKTEVIQEVLKNSCQRSGYLGNIRYFAFRNFPSSIPILMLLSRCVEYQGLLFGWMQESSIPIVFVTL